MIRQTLLATFIFLNTLTFGQDVEYTFHNPNDRIADCYITFKPQGQPKGLLLLLPSFGETPFLAASETSIPQTATENGLLTVIAALKDGRLTFYIDSGSQNDLDNLIEELLKKYNLDGKKFYLGGFSLGASGVVKYAERAYNSTSLKKPNAIFAIDPPLDYERLYNSLTHTIQFSKTEVTINEAKYLQTRIVKEIGFTPQQNIKVYYDLSPYSYTDTTQTEIKKITKCPIRLITEPDINWQIQERNRDYYDLNSIDCAAVVNYLKLLGNSNAILITTTDKGFRKMTTKRNPHSWSIAEPTETVNWLLKF